MALEDTLTLAAPGDYVRVFVDEGPTIHELLHQMTGCTLQLSSYITKLLDAFPARQKRLMYLPLRYSNLSANNNSLNERELEVLRLIAAGRSNREITDKLVIAISTVKIHINSCYSKLGVHSRTQVLSRARELGLI